MAQQNGQNLSTGLVVGLASVFLAVSGTAAWLVWHVPGTAPVPTTQPTNPPQVGQSPSATSGRMEVYWLQAQQNKVALVPSQINLDQSSPTPEVALKLGLERLLSGPVNADVSTTIPAGTKLNQVKVDSEGIHVDLSKEFIKGGGSTSMQGRLGQIVYTASSLDPNARVWITVAGEPLKVLGGEGIEVEQPMTRQFFSENFKP
jgi:spore germination protein GerM